MRALLVDDEPTVCLLLGRILARDFDCVATPAANGLEALDLLSRHAYDFMVLDLLMPVMDGLEALRAIRADQRLRELPIMVMSTVREELRVREAIDLGIGTYLTKPLRPTDVALRLQRFVGGLGRPALAPRQCAGITPGSRILVVDGDRDFRHFAHGVLAHSHLVSSAMSGAQGLRLCLELRPALVLLGEGLGAIPAAAFLEKLRAIPEIAGTPVIAIRAGRDAAPLAADGLMMRTFIPDAFLQQFTRLTADEPPTVRWLRSRPWLRPRLITSTEQVLGMMLGLEVLAQEASEPPAMDRIGVAVPIVVAGADLDLRVGIRATLPVARLLATRLLQAEEASDDDARSALEELANMLGGRVLEALRGEGDDARLGLPDVLPGHAAAPGTVITVTFASVDGDFTFDVVCLAIDEVASVPALPAVP
ncbi:hypothetical protein TBR22_A31930 [Luteitalea sp. TBR-22]|uniref:response regulator n=1 Tax=Luteitalea sp. TBR-22 TaxID=2802971 RepID=UPI001AFB5B5B|nr:response regulator [Luteitalea sp. TBR-22]BCS33965.1 hypothetical protein TBR22_A31930 [Luteitalea sp. TBR-22]